ncbi:hypothetical protein AKJ63_01760, partial [candidate division MSBL1 archaeon SCGC-AAA259D18]
QKTRQNISNPNLPTLLIDLKSHRDAKLQKSDFFKVSIEEVNVPYGTVKCFRLSFGDHYKCYDLNTGILVKAKASGTSPGVGRVRQSIKLTDTNIPVSGVEKDESLSLIWMSLGIGIGIALVIGAAIKKRRSNEE